MLNARYSERGRKMRLASTSPSYQYKILCGIGKFHGRKSTDQLLIHFGLTEIKAKQVTVNRELCSVDLIADRTYAMTAPKKY